MPILEDDDMIHRVLLWKRLGDGADGQPVYDEPREVWASWSWRRRRERGPDGTPIFLDASMFVGQDDYSYATVGSRVWLAPDHSVEAIGQWYGSGSAGQTSGIMEVASANQSWDMKGIEVSYTIGLVWWRERP